jgi:preprotein translocase subunit SecE
MKTKDPFNQGNAVVAFLRQVRDELNQVTWPTKDQTVRLSTLVIIVTIIIGIYLGTLDYLFTQLMGLII